jgi:hypothetical protein
MQDEEQEEQEGGVDDPLPDCIVYVSSLCILPQPAAMNAGLKFKCAFPQPSIV